MNKIDGNTLPAKINSGTQSTQSTSMDSKNGQLSSRKVVNIEEFQKWAIKYALENNITSKDEFKEHLLQLRDQGRLDFLNY